jgi:hypothetical protein
MKLHFLSLCASLYMIAPSSVFAAETSISPDLAVIGAPSQSRCDKWILFADARKADATGPNKDIVMAAVFLNDSMKDWALGFMSGFATVLKAQGSRNVLAYVSEDDLVKKIDAECRDKPKEPFITAIVNVFRQYQTGP